MRKSAMTRDALDAAARAYLARIREAVAAGMSAAELHDHADSTRNAAPGIVAILHGYEAAARVAMASEDV